MAFICFALAWYLIIHFFSYRFLSVKKWLLRKKHQIELARKRGWKGYWVCLKGTTLLFYPCDSREGRSVEAAPKHLIIVDGAIMQPIPEHPKRDYIFCLSTAFGDAYLFQAPCQVRDTLSFSANNVSEINFTALNLLYCPRWSSKTGWTAYIVHALRRLLVIAGKRERFTYFKKKFTASRRL